MWPQHRHHPSWDGHHSIRFKKSQSTIKVKLAHQRCYFKANPTLWEKPLKSPGRLRRFLKCTTNRLKLSLYLISSHVSDEVLRSNVLYLKLMVMVDMKHSKQSSLMYQHQQDWDSHQKVHSLHDYLSLTLVKPVTQTETTTCTIYYALALSLHILWQATATPYSNH